MAVKIILRVALVLFPIVSTLFISPSLPAVAGDLCASPIKLNRADVVFLFDIGQYTKTRINETADNIELIVSKLKNSINDVQFSLATFQDYSPYPTGPQLYSGTGGGLRYHYYYGDTVSSTPPSRSGSSVPFARITGLSPDVSTLKTGLNAIRSRDEAGGDAPESGSRGLFETYRTTTWRANSSKIIIYFTQMPVHDSTFGGRDFGKDPGPDNILNTSDDLTYTGVIDQLTAAGVQVVTLDSQLYSFNAPYPINNDFTLVTSELRYLADRTRGSYQLISQLSGSDSVPVKPFWQGITDGVAQIAKNNCVPPAPPDIVTQLRVSPNLAVAPSSPDSFSVLTYNVTAKNVGPNRAQKLQVELPLDPRLTLLNASFGEPKQWVSSVTTDTVLIDFGPLGPMTDDEPRSVTATLTLAVKADAAPGPLSTRAKSYAGWDGPDIVAFSNAVSLDVGPNTASDGTNDTTQPLGVAYADGKAAFTADFLIPNEKISVWTTLSDKTTLDLGYIWADTNGVARYVYDLQNLPPGSAVLVFYGQRSQNYGTAIYSQP